MESDLQLWFVSELVKVEGSNDLEVLYPQSFTSPGAAHDFISKRLLLSGYTGSTFTVRQGYPTTPVPESDTFNTM